MIKNIDIFEKDPIPRAVLKLALPTVLSMIVAVFYNMVDTFFVGMTNDPNQVAAVSVATPVFLFFMAAGNIFGMGGSSFLSRALGEKQYDKAKKISSFCLYAGILTGVIGAVLMFVFMSNILHAVGTSENTFGFAKAYLSWIAWGGPAIVISTAFGNLVRGEGAAQSAMKGMMIGTVANIILDPIFILDSFWGLPCLGLGVAGAAIATDLGNLVSIAIFFGHILKPSSILTLSPKYFAVRNGILKGVLLILMNKYLVTYGDVAVAGMGIAMKANMLVVFIQMGIAAGVQPLIGYNYGAANYKRMKGAMKFSMICDIMMGILLGILYFIFTKEIVSVFIRDEAVINMSVKMLRALMFSSPVLGLLFILNFSFQAMGKAKESLAIAVSRQGFVFVPCTIILNRLIGLEGLILSQPIADIVSILMATIMFLFMNRTFRQIEGKA